MVTYTGATTRACKNADSGSEGLRFQPAPGDASEWPSRDLVQWSCMPWLIAAKLLILVVSGCHSKLIQTSTPLFTLMNTATHFP